MVTAIVTDVRYRMSLAVIRELGERGVPVLVCEEDSCRAPLGFYSRCAARRETLPADGYADALLALCCRVFAETGEKPALLPVGARTLAVVAARSVDFAHVSGFAVPTEGQLTVANDKSAVAKLAASLGVPVPRSYDPRPDESGAEVAKRAEYPCIVKPLCGEKFGLSAAERYHICRTPAELAEKYDFYRDLTGAAPVVQEYLCGGGMGFSVLAREGEIVRAVCHRRLREYPVSGGPSTCCVSARGGELQPYVRDMVRAMNYTGLAMFEFKLDAAGMPRLLEINPRVWGTFPLTRVARADFSYGWYCMAAGLPLPPQPPFTQKKMTFFPSDFASAVGYLRRGEGKKALPAVGDFFSPAVRDGLFELRDPRPALCYYLSLARKGK